MANQPSNNRRHNGRKAITNKNRRPFKNYKNMYKRLNKEMERPFSINFIDQYGENWLQDYSIAQDKYIDYLETCTPWDEFKKELDLEDE